MTHDNLLCKHLPKVREHHRCCILKTRGKVTRGCNEQLKAFFSHYQQGQNFIRGDLTGGVTSRIFPIARNTFGTHCIGLR